MANRRRNIDMTEREPRLNRRQRRDASSVDSPVPDPVDMYDVDNWGRLVDDNRHLVCDMHTDTVDDYDFMGSPKSCCLFYTTVASTNARVRAIIEATRWHYICSVSELRHDRKVVRSLVERWWDTTHTFHLPHVELGFTPFDFTCITGIPVGKGNYPPYDVKAWRPLRAVQTFFPTATTASCDSSGIKCKFLKDLLFSLDLPQVEDALVYPTGAEWVIEQRWLRAFFLLAIGEIFFPMNKKWVSFGWFEAVQNTIAVSTYDWGTPILARMYSSLNESSRKIIKKGQFCWTVLEYWYYEYIRLPAPVFKEDADLEVYPRILRWAPENLVPVRGQVAHLLGTCRRKLEEATPDSVNWRPFHNSELISQQADCLASYNASALRFVLVENDTCLWYLGDRCWRQLQGVTSIPQPPPRSMRSDYERWLAEGALAVLAEGLRVDASESQWRAYWATVSGGVRMGLRHRDVNTDEVNAAASYDPRLLPQRPRGLAETQGVYQTQALPDLSAYFDDMTLSVRDSQRQIRLSPDPDPIRVPYYPDPEAMGTLANQYRDTIRGYRNEIDYLYERFGYPTSDLGYYAEYQASNMAGPSRQHGQDEDDDDDDATQFNLDDP